MALSAFGFLDCYILSFNIIISMRVCDTRKPKWKAQTKIKEDKNIYCNCVNKIIFSMCSERNKNHVMNEKECEFLSQSKIKNENANHLNLIFVFYFNHFIQCNLLPRIDHFKCFVISHVFHNFVWVIECLVFIIYLYVTQLQ